MRRVERPLVIVVATLAIVQGFGVFLDLIGGHEAMTNHLLRLTLVFVIAIYVAISQYRLRQAKDEANFHRALWEVLPYGVCFYNPHGQIEFYNNEYTRFVTIEKAEVESKDAILQAARTGMISHCQYSNNDHGAELYSRVIPVKQNAIVTSVIHIVRECTAEARLAQHRESDYIRIIKMLVNMFELKDPFGQGHSETVSNLAQDIAHWLHLSQADAACIVRAALFHDIGKIVLPDSIFVKQEALTDDDHAVIREHSRMGAEIVKTIPLLQDTTDIIKHHHERYDGRGYPDGLKGDKIPMGSRIIVIADAFDAITTGRTVFGKCDVESALSIMQLEKGRQFDPELIDAFVAMIRAGRMGIHIQ